MQKLTAAEMLKKSISVLECRQLEEGDLLMEQLKATFESLKPMNILRKMFNDITAPSELKDNLVQTAAGLLSGYISSKLLVRSSRNPLLRLAGVVVQYGVTNFISRNSDTIKAISLYYINKLAGSSRKQ